MASLFIKKSDQFETTAGAPAAGYYLHFLVVGTTTTKNTYPSEADAIAGTNANSNPITLNAAGRSTNDIWITGRYRFIFSDNATPGSGTTLDTALIEDTIPASDFQDSAPTYGGTNTGTANALVFSMSPALTAYTAGMVLRGRIAADNSTAVTINVNGVGVKSLVKRDGAALISGDLQGPDIIEFVYDSTTDVFRLMSANAAAMHENNAYLNVNQSFTKAQGVNRSALTDAATVAVDASLSNVFTVTLGGNRTLGQPTNPKDGQSITIFITQDGTGSRTLAYHADWLFAGGVDPVLTTTAAAVDVLTGVYNGATTKWYAQLAKAFA
jgi:hypothetical protein